MRSHGILAALAPGLALLSSVSATRLYITTYGSDDGTTPGGVHTVELPAGLSTEETWGNVKLQVLSPLAKSTACSPTPSWLTQAGDTLYCTDEGFNPSNKALVSLEIGNDVTVASLAKQPEINAGPVSSAVFGNGTRLIAASYGGGGITTYDISNPKVLTMVQNLTFTLPVPALADPQQQPRPHHAVLDPTGNFILVPDLGSDLVRVLSINQTTKLVTEASPISFPRGNGPRHGAFVKHATKTFFYVVTELKNNLFGYEVTYNTNNTLSFKQVFSANTHGEAVDTPPVAGSQVRAAEISLSPDSQFIVLSSRFERNLVPNIDPSNSTMMESDLLITFSIQETGQLRFYQSQAMGGVHPRHFSFNKNGTLVASVAVNDKRVNVLERDPNNGMIGAIVATVNFNNESPNMVIFDEA